MTSFPTIASAARDIAAKKISPVEFAKDRLAQAEKMNPTLNAFIRFTPDIALEQARAAEARQMAGALHGPLDGIPIAHKDIYETAGSPPPAIPACWNTMCPRQIPPWCGAGAKPAR